MIRTNSLAAKQGVSTAEFLIVAPAVILLLFFGYDLNRRAEESASTAIATRNLLTRPGQDTDENKRRDLTGNFLGKGGGKGAVLVDNDVRSAAQDYRDSGAVKPGYLFAPTVHENKNYGSGADLGINSDRVSTPPGAVVYGDQGGSMTYSQMRTGVDKIAGVGRAVDQLISVLAAAGLTEHDGIRVAEAVMSTNGQEQGAQRVINHMLDVLGTSGESSGPERGFRERMYLHPEDGFHPNNIKNQALLGFAIGAPAHGKWSGYADDCMNKFGHGDDCKKVSPFALLVGAIGTVKSAVMCVAAFFSFGSTEGASEAAKIGVEEAVKSIVSQVITSAIEGVFDSAVKGVTAQIDTAVDKAMEGVTNPVREALDQATDIEGIKGVKIEAQK